MKLSLLLRRLSPIIAFWVIAFLCHLFPIPTDSPLWWNVPLIATYVITVVGFGLWSIASFDNNDFAD